MTTSLVSSTLETELVAIRRDLHRHPELGFELPRTASIVSGRLAALGFAVRTGVAGHGIVADLPGEAAGPTLLLRADMDALPITERTGADYASTIEGAMHACGHDAHVAALLGAAEILAAGRRDLAGRVRLLFQPAEELGLGAARMIEEGALEGVDRAVGIHVFGPAPVGVVATRGDVFLAGADAFEIRIFGSAGHGGMTVGFADPVVVGAHVVTALQVLVSRETRPGEPVVLSVASVQAGSPAANVIVEKMVLRGTLRWFDAEERRRLLERLPALTRGVCESFGARSEFEVLASVPPLRNDAAVLDIARTAVERTGRAKIVDPGRITPSDDFAEIATRVPSVFLGFGSGGPRSAPHHHPEFVLDERVIGLMAETAARTAFVALAPPGEAG